MKYLPLVAAAACLFAVEGHAAQPILGYQPPHDMASLGFPGWSVIIPDDMVIVDEGTSPTGTRMIRFEAHVPAINGGFAPTLNVHFHRTDSPSSSDIRAIASVFLFNETDVDWREIDLSLITSGIDHPVLQSQPLQFDPVFFTQSISSSDAFTHTFYSHFHPSPSLNLSAGPVNNFTAWTQSFPDACLIAPFGPDGTLLDESQPMGPPASLHVFQFQPVTKGGFTTHFTDIPLHMFFDTVFQIAFPLIAKDFFCGD